MRVKLPRGHEHLENIPPGTRHGYRFCIKGQSTIRRPDNCWGNFWVELNIPEMPGGKKDDGHETF